MKPILTLLAFLLFSAGHAQEQAFQKPDYNKIEKAIKKKSNLKYSKLMDRYLDGDSTMTMEEKQHLYYGYVFQPSYSPYGRSPYQDSVKILLEKPDPDSLSLVTVIAYTNKMLATFPFDLRAIYNQLFALDQLKRTEEFNHRMAQFTIILDALFSSGTGLSKEEAYYVINTSHEYDMLNILGFEFGGEQSLTEHYDYLTVEENEYGIEGLYFDVSPCLNHLNSMFK